jgi:uncharacterized membrane protein (UPF0127 family)
MEKIEINIGNKEYKVQVAQTEEELYTGLQGVQELPEGEGMLFVFEDTEEVSIWMKDTLIPLDIIFINLDLEVQAVHTGVPKSEEMLTENNISFVLEVNPNSGIKVGDELEFSPNSKVKSDKMIVLNGDGTPQIELEGGERIFSRANTKTLIRFAKKAIYSNKNSDFKALGKRVFKFLEAQDNNEPEFVELKN